MTAEFEMRDSVADDLAALESLYPKAFPDEDLLPLIRDLLQDPAITMSIVATIDSRIVGHAIFTSCGIEGHAIDASLLGPLAVTPARHGQGIGSALVRAGLRRLTDSGTQVVCVLGDPAFYGRLGFQPDLSIKPPYPLPEAWIGAWQSLHLGDVPSPCAGKLIVPEQWLKPALWAP
jgi:putative acetyltransferase